VYVRSLKKEVYDLDSLFSCQPPCLTTFLRSQPYFRLALIVVAITSGSLVAQTNIAIGNTTLQPSVKRLGINLGTLDYYDSGQTTQNMLMQNPGFEGQVWNSTIRCASGSAYTCVDENQWGAWPAGFWAGATFEVFYGSAAGRTGTVGYSTAPANGQGVTLYFNSSGAAPSAGDYIIVRKSIPGGSTGGWWPSTSGSGYISDNFSDLPPGTLGKQTVSLGAPGAYDVASIAGFLDSVAGKTFIQLNGTYQLQFKAKGTGGSNQIKLQVARTSVATYVSQNISLTSGWNTYTVNFNAAENGSAIGTIGVSFTTVGADSFYLDDVSFTKTNGDPTNTTVFRDPVVNALRTLQPGVLRYWGGQLGDTLDNLITPQFGRQRSGYLAWYSESDTVDYGLHDFLQLCQAVGAEPWFVVPTTFSTTDASNLIEYLGGSTGTTYGAKRAALGQPTPWTQVFSKIHLEFGNEAWNPTFRGGSIEWPIPYGGRAQTIFGVMRANPSYASNFDLVLGGQAAYPGLNTQIQNACNNNDSFGVAPYAMNQVDSYWDNESLFGSTFAEGEAFMSSSGTAEGLTPGMVLQDYRSIQSSNHPVPLSFYEFNLSTLAGGISQQALNTYTPSLGAGLMVADTMLLSLRQFGVVNQELFALPQWNFTRTDGKTVLLWGSVVDMGVTDRKRPQFLALELANQALSNGATMLQTVHSGADPTWNQPLVNSVQLNGAHYLHSFAFVNGQSYSAVVFNLSRTSTLGVTFSGANAPNGTVEMQQLTSAYPTDTNENSNVVNIATSTLSNFNGGTNFWLPPYSMTVLTWGGQLPVSNPPPTAPTAPATGPAPVISAPSVSSITTTSATFGWTTDQAASSQVQYGTTAAYGSSSALNAFLSTIHSVTLTGLTAGTTYSYELVSVNSAGTVGTLGNLTFTTAAGATPAAPVSSPSGTPPRVEYVNFWGTTSSGITIAWSTNVPATTAVGYGVTTSLGQISSGQMSLAVSHGVTLTGLNSGTTYYFVAQSTDANGNTGYSSVYSFTTLGASSAVANTSALLVTSSGSASTGPGPQISYVQYWGITGSGITISWSTNEPATTAVGYGPPGALSQITPVQTSLTNSHGVTLTGLAAGTTYSFIAQSADANGNVGYSATYTFTTSAISPPAS
jgi:hypothetical protein